jgi:hypothetical protein
VRETIGAAGYVAGVGGYAVGGVTDRDTRVPDCTTICSGATAVGTSAAGAGASMFVHAAIVSRTTSVSAGVLAPNVSAGALATTWSTLSSAALFGRDLARDCAELRAWDFPLGSRSSTPPSHAIAMSPPTLMCVHGSGFRTGSGTVPHHLHDPTCAG